MHREAVSRITAEHVPPAMMLARAAVLGRRVRVGELHGYRNAQVTVLAPTGTIGFMMDCDTTGIEPDLALVKYKKLVGGGVIKIVNNTVPQAMMRLGYTPEQNREIVAYIDKSGTMEGAPISRRNICRCSIAASGRRMAGVRSTRWVTSG